MNPLVPTAYDVVWSIAAFAVLAFTAVAVVSLILDRGATGLRFLLWFAVVLMVPVLGPTAWFWYGRRAVQAPRA
ncbi:PLDc N-terminal domain-containing protein [Streptomyces sp. AC495_CC817]|uniref:PLDc N-terminal domain-containing protein n=1 Tax=Streptomyces sp. AC495_CC817 TaxID=2823900 RepID=UPI001C275447|nr:PLDc N-terminal domain-containing protein [Streptomyces sp. AC495_CC817]